MPSGLFILTPFSRVENIPFYLHEDLNDPRITWVPIVHDAAVLDAFRAAGAGPRVRPLLVAPEWGDRNPCYWKLNRALDAGAAAGEWTLFMCDDDSLEAGFLDEFDALDLDADVVVTSMRRGDRQVGHPAYTLTASPAEMRVNHVGLEQLVYRAGALDTRRFDDSRDDADGAMAESIAADGSLRIAYLSKTFAVRFNYLQPGRWADARRLV
jgi:hypothetical protein